MMTRPMAVAIENLGIPELTFSAVECARWNPAAGCLIDRVERGLPLVISFAYRELQNLPAFDFFGRLKKLESVSRQKSNKLFVRDMSNRWYHAGVPGLGSDLDQVAESLRFLVESIAPQRVVTIGQSMGAYAAILFGMLIGADRIVAFGPLSHLNPREAARFGDTGFLDAMEALEADWPGSRYKDLVRLGHEVDFSGDLHVIFGTHPRQSDGVSSNFDAFHALRLAALPATRLEPYPDADHGIVPWLVEHKEIDRILARLLVGVDYPDRAAPGLAASDLPARSR